MLGLPKKSTDPCKISDYEQFCIMREGIKWYSKGKLYNDENHIEEIKEKGEPFPDSIDELPRFSLTVLDIKQDSVTFLTSDGYKFITPFEKVKSFKFIKTVKRKPRCL
jgi:hypothetical protein